MNTTRHYNSALPFLFLGIVLFILPLSCTSIEFVKTGNEYTPLPPNSDVQVLLTVDKNQFDEIGIADIGGVSLPVRIEKAKEIARSKGGDVIVPATMCNEESKKRMRSGYIIQSFYILKTRSTAIIQKPVEETKSFTQMVEKELLPEKQSATFQQLLREYPQLHGEVFTNTMQPSGFYKIPPSLLVYGLSQHKLCLMKFDEENSALVFIPRDKINTIKASIEGKKSLSIDYTPLGVYKEKYPVLRMVSQ